MKKRSIISKASIKQTSEKLESPPQNLIFSPSDPKKSSSKFSTMKKSNTFTNQPRFNASSTLNSSNRFLFRGNEEFHNTVNRQNTNFRENINQTEQPLYVKSGSRQRIKKDK